MQSTIAKKLGIREKARAILIGAPDDTVATMALPPLRIAARLQGEFDYVHLFVKEQAELVRLVSKVKAHLKPTGTCWISWPKGGQLETDLTITEVIRIGYDAGLVESKAVSLDAIWSALKFTHPKPGKVYNNSYGQLKDR